MAGETDLKNREAFTSLLRTVLEAKKPDSLLVAGKNCGYAENVAAKIAARENTSVLVDVMRCFGLGTSTAQAVEG